MRENEVTEFRNFKMIPAYDREVMEDVFTVKHITFHCYLNGQLCHTSSCPLFDAGVVMTPLLTSLQQQNAHGNRWQIPVLWGSAPQYPIIPYPSST